MSTPTQINSFLSYTRSSMPPPPPLHTHFTANEFSSDDLYLLTFLNDSPGCSNDLDGLINHFRSTMPFSTNEESRAGQLDYTENGMALAQLGGGGGDDLSANHLQVEECGDNNGMINTHRTVKKKKSRRQSLVKRRTAHEKIGIDDLKQLYGKTRAEAAESLKVSVPTFKRTCRRCGILTWPLSKKKNKDSSPESNITDEIQPYPVIAKVKYEDYFIKFEISSASNLAVLQEEIKERLRLKDGSFNIKYADNEGDWVLIKIDADFRLCMNMTTLDTPKVKMLVLPCSD